MLTDDGVLPYTSHSRVLRRRLWLFSSDPSAQHTRVPIVHTATQSSMATISYCCDNRVLVYLVGRTNLETGCD